MCFWRLAPLTVCSNNNQTIFKVKTEKPKNEKIRGVQSFTRDYDDGTLAITQTAYDDNILERFGMQDANAAHTPGYGPELLAEQPENKLLGAEATKFYQSIRESLLYLAH